MGNKKMDHIILDEATDFIHDDWLGVLGSMTGLYRNRTPNYNVNGPTGAMVKKRKAIKAKRAKDKSNRKKARRH